jgi:hypothetical protein
MYSSRLRQREKPLSQMTKAEKEQRAMEMNAANASTKPRKTKYNKKAQGGVQTGFLKRAVRSVFGGGRKSNASTAKGRRAGNTSDSFQCTPTSTSKKCRPGGK